jgi:phosphohistidine phosphatase
MEIYLLRHGIAVERGDYSGPDEERALTTEGRRKVRDVAEAMRAMRLSFDVILSSALVRALQTAEIVVESLRLKRRLQVTEHLAPAASIAKLFSQMNSLQPAPDSVLLVGHEPDMSRLASRLLTGRDDLAMTFKKAGLCKITADRAGSGRATLEWFLTARQMELMR